jgi:general secretion pathway protein I
MNARGFTLVEVLVALAIVAVALTAGLRAVGSMAQFGAEVRLRLLAQLSARNEIALLHATQSFPDLGVTARACSQGDVALVCRREVKGTPNEFFRRVEVQVYSQAQPQERLAALVGILPKER